MQQLNGVVLALGMLFVVGSRAISGVVFLNEPRLLAASAPQPQTQVPPPAPPPAMPQVMVQESMSVVAGALDMHIDRRDAADAASRAPEGTAFAPGVARPGAGITDPVPIRHPNPPYTLEAMRMDVQGVVDVEAVVHKDGTVGDVRIIKSVDKQYGMDQEAMEAAKQWTFTPARDRDGNPVDIIVVIGFDLRHHGSLTVTGPTGASVTTPSKIRDARPIYPDAARNTQLQGTVVVEAFTNARGVVVFARIKQSVPGLDEAVLTTARRWWYTPTRLDGVPTETLVTATIDFRLNPK